MGFAVVRARLVSIFSALLFALHPVQTQSVTYIVQRMESLSATFFLLALMLFAKGAASMSAARRWGYVITSYSIHYTKLYDRLAPRGGARSLVQPRPDRSHGS